MGSGFAEETVVRPVADGRYAGHVDDAWVLRPLPQGGIVTAIAARAMLDELAEPSQRLRSLHTTFVGQVADGPVEVDVEVLRRGRSMSHLRADLRNPRAPSGHLTSAVFGASRRGFEFTDLHPPDVPPPSDCPSFRDPRPPEAPEWEPMRFWEERLEGRPALGDPPWEDSVRERAETATWYRFDEPPFLADGSIDPLSLIVMADVMPSAAGQRVGPVDEPWFGPSVDLTVHLLDECRSEWVLAHNTARHASDGYASADMALWDCGPQGRDRPRLVAYATQVFFFTFLA